jgi:hypothetical protein
MRLLRWFPVLLCCATIACATYREDLNRGQRLYEENQYDRALAIWRNLENDTDSLGFNDQARYAYLRGMTDYRLGFRADARHWLAIAKATEHEHPGGLNPEWQERLAKSLEELNQDVYGGTERFGKNRSTFVEHGNLAPSSAEAPDGASITAPPR